MVGRRHRGRGEGPRARGIPSEASESRAYLRTKAGRRFGRGARSARGGAVPAYAVRAEADGDEIERVDGRGLVVRRRTEERRERGRAAEGREVVLAVLVELRKARVAEVRRQLGDLDDPEHHRGRADVVEAVRLVAVVDDHRDGPAREPEAVPRLVDEARRLDLRGRDQRLAALLRGVDEQRHAAAVVV